MYPFLVHLPLCSQAFLVKMLYKPTKQPVHFDVHLNIMIVINFKLNIYTVTLAETVQMSLSVVTLTFAVQLFVFCPYCL